MLPFILVKDMKDMSTWVFYSHVRAVSVFLKCLHDNTKSTYYGNNILDVKDILLLVQGGMSSASKIP